MVKRSGHPLLPPVGVNGIYAFQRSPSFCSRADLAGDQRCVRSGANPWKVVFRFPPLCLFPFAMTLQNRDAQIPFTTKDGSTIRSLLDRTNAPVQLQSLAEATLALGQATERHYHRLSEEIYYLLEGTGEMELNGERQPVRPGDAILIPPGAWHQITGTSAIPLRFLCACSPPYEHGDTYFE